MNKIAGYLVQNCGIKSLAKRSRIILLASQGISNQAIASQVGLHYNHDAFWRSRFLAALPSLREIEAGAPEKPEEEIRLLISDRKRSGAPPTFTPEQILAIIDLACKGPLLAPFHRKNGRSGFFCAVPVSSKRIVNISIIRGERK